MTTEHYGVISGLLLIAIIYAYGGTEQGDTKSPVSVQFWIDNEEVLRRAKKAGEREIKLKAFAIRDYSLKCQMEEIIQFLNPFVKVHFEKVKSHHEENNENLSYEAKLNIMVDRIANHIQSDYKGPVYIAKNTQFDGVRIHDNQGIGINDFDKWIRHKIKGYELKEYLMEKKQWQSQTWEMIEWNNLGKTIKSYPLTTQFSILQMVHNWQNVGYQNQKFAHSKYNKGNITRDPRETELINKEIRRISKCPFSCGHTESHLHYMECEECRPTQLRAKLLKTMKAKLEKLNVYGAIISMFISGITWKERKVIPPYVSLRTRTDQAVTRAAKEQEEIGGKNLRRGIISSGWATAQRTYLEETGTPNSQEWGKILVQTVIDVTYGMWTERNKELHGESKKEHNQKYVVELQEKVYFLYARLRETKVTTDDTTEHIFGKDRTTTKRKIKKRGIMGMETWIGMAEETIAILERRAQHSIKEWIIRKNTKIKYPP